MNKKIFIFVAVLVFLLVGGLGVLLKGSEPKPAPRSDVIGENTSTTGGVKEFTVTGTNYAFDPSTITVNKGDMIKIVFKDDDGIHNLVVDGYGVSTKTIGSGQDVIEFVADKTGSFEYYCSVGSHRDLGMTGTLIVNK